jgi:hypothetical protein
MPASGLASGPVPTQREIVMRTVLTFLAVGLLAGGLRADDGPVPLKLKQAGAGDVIKETKTEKANNKIVISVNGTDQAREEAVTSKLVYTDHILERPLGAKQPTKLKRTYETAELDDGMPGDLDLAGKTVLIEKADAGYRFSVDGKPVGEKAEKLLAKEFGKDKSVSDEDLLPKDPVKVGGTWKVDVAKLAKEAAGELDIDEAKSSATGKLLKLYEKGGHKYGQIEVSMELALNKIGPAGQQIELKPGAKITITATLDLCIDGSLATMSGKMTTKGTFAGSAMGVDLKFDLSSVREGGGEEVKK